MPRFKQRLLCPQDAHSGVSTGWGGYLVGKGRETDRVNVSVRVEVPQRWQVAPPLQRFQAPPR